MYLYIEQCNGKQKCEKCEIYLYFVDMLDRGFLQTDLEYLSIYNLCPVLRSISFLVYLIHNLYITI